MANRAQTKYRNVAMVEDILPFLLANWWYLVLGIICALLLLFGYQKAAMFWGAILILLIVIPIVIPFVTRMLGAII